MDRRSLVLGFVAGGWVATLAFGSPFSLFRSASAEPPVIPLPPAVPPQQPQPGAPTPNPLDPQSPGRTVNPSDGSGRPRGVPSYGTGTAAWNTRAIALSGSVGSGESVVYYIDTETQRICVYQYKPGDRGGISLLAARHIDMDLKIEGYRDRSEKSRDQMKADYEREFPAHPLPPEIPTKKVEIDAGK
jgi:hypothetical protein